MTNNNRERGGGIPEAAAEEKKWVIERNPDSLKGEATARVAREEVAVGREAEEAERSLKANGVSEQDLRVGRRAMRKFSEGARALGVMFNRVVMGEGREIYKNRPIAKLLEGSSWSVYGWTRRDTKDPEFVYGAERFVDRGSPTEEEARELLRLLDETGPKGFHKRLLPEVEALKERLRARLRGEEDPNRYRNAALESHVRFERLYRELRQKGTVVGSQKTYKAQDLIDKIVEFREKFPKGELKSNDIDLIPNTDGLRQRVMDLLDADQAA